ncbi:nuclear pore complex protein GP210 [Daucus carota subsp. sativus]|uniref:BIG2 domain-containing protein n=1 Tax=Daucus carota subsp. sativus TaxID=79200 RepID=A0A162B1I4_DAUCS|nr:PREDICTED: nuclear pore complex protein GP210 [Daucus carota subsp. sativus]
MSSSSIWLGLVVVVVVLLVSNAASYSKSESSNSGSRGPHIADVNILLPPKMTHPVHYRLQASDGCFKWSWDHHDILSVLPEYNSSNHCSTSAHLKSIAPYSGRKETAVYATDVDTGRVIRCKVYIDNVSRIQIFHSSVKLDLDGLATLRVRAFDSEENVFSSLVGIRFMWQLEPETDESAHHLVHVPLKLSPLSDCGGLCGDLDVQIKLEDSGVFSDLYVVKGTEIGHERVSVDLLEPMYDQMADSIVLTVAEAMSLYPPSPVFVLVGAVVQYLLTVVRGNIPRAVTLPSPYHQWSVLNSSVSRIDKTMGIAHALNLGVTTVSVEDTRVAGHIQLSSLHVVLPDSLYIYISPLSHSGDILEGAAPNPSVSRWYVVTGRQYLLEMKVFSRVPESQEIYITETDDIKLYDDHSEFWNIFPVSDTTTSKLVCLNSKILKAMSYGLGKLTATLTYSNGVHEVNQALKVVQEIMVCEQVKFSKDKRSASGSILLPWAPSVHQEVELKATGGCAISSSDYKWFSSDMSIVCVSAHGIVQSKRPGKVTIKVVSSFDSFNYDELEIEVSIPSSMIMLQQFPVETVVGSNLAASVTLKDSNGDNYFRCDAFSSAIQWNTGSDSFTIVYTERESFLFDEQDVPDLLASLYSPPCAWARIYASATGRTMLHASLKKDYHPLDHSLTGSIDLKASALISAYLPLFVHQAGDGNQYGGYWFNLSYAEANNHLENLKILNLVPGTHMDVTLSGGPDQWGGGVEFTETVEILPQEQTKQKGVLVHNITTIYGSSYRISCENWGEFKVLFKRGNLAGDDHILPAVAEAELLLSCILPSSISIVVDSSVNALDVIHTAMQADRNSEQVRALPITVANGRTIRVSAVGISDSGNAFGNSSSLSISWEARNCDGLAFWDAAATSISNWERFLVLQNSTGLCTVRATVGGFIETLSNHRFIKSYGSSKSLTDAVQLQLVSTLKVTPEFSLLLFSHLAILDLSISGGSCALTTVVNDTQVAELIDRTPDLHCSQLSLAPKSLGTALVTVYDMGLSPPLAATSVVQVADVDWLKITSGELISLVEGSSQSIDLLAGVNNGRTFDFSQYMYMKIRVHIEDHNIVSLLDGISDGYLKAPKFILQAKNHGITTLYVSARQQSGREILSQFIKVEVYAPLSIRPSNIYLVPGASYVLTVEGGPTIGGYVEYGSMNDETAIIHKSSGRLIAIAPGNTTLVARIYSKGDEVMCHAFGYVVVEIPSSAMLNVQSEQLAIGSELQIYPSFTNGNLFSLYEVCKNYEWSVEDEDVLTFKVVDLLHGYKLGASSIVLEASGSNEKLDLRFIREFYGKSSGQTHVSVSFSCNFVSRSFSQSRLYTASILLSVVPDLPLALGKPVTWVLPPHYITSNLLPSSSGSYSQGDAQSSKGTITYTLLKEYGGQKDIELVNEAISIQGVKIQTRESNNIGCIQAKDRLTGRFEIASCVRVAEVAQIRVSRHAFPFYSVNLAVGAELSIPLIYYDAFGYPFYEAYNIVLYDVETNYGDIVSINDTHDGNIYLKALQFGRALVRISLKNNSTKSDYLLITIGARLYPHNPLLQLGNRLNFSIEGLTDQVSGWWTSVNTSTVSIDRVSGEAEAIGEGSTQVIYESSDFKLLTFVTVSKGHMITVNAPKGILTNAPFSMRGYKFLVTFSDAFEPIREPGGAVKTLLHECEVEPHFVGYADPWMDFESGMSYCLFFPYSPGHLVRSVGNLKDTRRDISVTINAFVRGTNNISGSASAFFVGGFAILDMDHNSLHLNLTSKSNKSVITVVGNTDVVVDSQGRNQLLITPIHRENNGVAGRAEYEVKVLSSWRFKDKLIISLAANGQRVEIDVNYEPEKIPALPSSTKVSNWMVILVCSSVLISTLILFLCYLDRSNRYQANAAPTTRTATVQSPATPPRSSPSVVNEHSPQTPQAFIDYVRRTVDETPYYRKDPRRRFNAQNTF